MSIAFHGTTEWQYGVCAFGAGHTQGVVGVVEFALLHIVPYSCFDDCTEGVIKSSAFHKMWPLVLGQSSNKV